MECDNFGCGSDPLFLLSCGHVFCRPCKEQLVDPLQEVPRAGEGQSVNLHGDLISTPKEEETDEGENARTGKAACQCPLCLRDHLEITEYRLPAYFCLKRQVEKRLEQLDPNDISCERCLLRHFRASKEKPQEPGPGQGPGPEPGQGPVEEDECEEKIREAEGFSRWLQIFLCRPCYRLVREGKDWIEQPLSAVEVGRTPPLPAQDEGSLEKLRMKVILQAMAEDEGKGEKEEEGDPDFVALEQVFDQQQTHLPLRQLKCSVHGLRVNWYNSVNGRLGCRLCVGEQAAPLRPGPWILICSLGEEPRNVVLALERATRFELDRLKAELEEAQDRSSQLSLDQLEGELSERLRDFTQRQELELAQFAENLDRARQILTAHIKQTRIRQEEVEFSQAWAEGHLRMLQELGERGTPAEVIASLPMLQQRVDCLRGMPPPGPGLVPPLHYAFETLSPLTRIPFLMVAHGNQLALFDAARGEAYLAFMVPNHFDKRLPFNLQIDRRFSPIQGVQALVCHKDRLGYLLVGRETSFESPGRIPEPFDCFPSFQAFPQDLFYVGAGPDSIMMVGRKEQKTFAISQQGGCLSSQGSFEFLAPNLFYQKEGDLYGLVRRQAAPFLFSLKCFSAYQLLSFCQSSRFCYVLLRLPNPPFTCLLQRLQIQEKDGEEEVVFWGMCELPFRALAMSIIFEESTIFLVTELAPQLVIEQFYHDFGDEKSLPPPCL